LIDLWKEWKEKKVDSVNGYDQCSPTEQPIPRRYKGYAYGCHSASLNIRANHTLLNIVLLSDQMIRKVVCSIQIGHAHLTGAEVKAANGAIVQREPGLQSVRGVTPGCVEDGEYQMAKKSTMTENGDAMFRSSLHIPMTSEQIR